MPVQTLNGPLVRQDQIRSIWQAYDLGEIDHVAPTPSRMRNESYIVNREWFLRLNTLDPGVARFGNERVACPCPLSWSSTNRAGSCPMISSSSPGCLA